MKHLWVIPLLIGGVVIIGYMGYLIMENIVLFGLTNLRTMALELGIAGIAAFLVSRYFFNKESIERDELKRKKRKRKEWIFYEVKRTLIDAGTSLPDREELENFDLIDIHHMNPTERVIFAKNSILNIKTILGSNTEVLDIDLIQEIYIITSKIEKGFAITDERQAAINTLDEVDKAITDIIRIIKESENRSGE